MNIQLRGRPHDPPTAQPAAGTHCALAVEWRARVPAKPSAALSAPDPAAREGARAVSGDSDSERGKAKGGGAGVVL